MALKLKYTDEHGVVHIDMSPTNNRSESNDIKDPKFDTINTRFAQYDLFGAKYDSGGEAPQSLFRSRYNSIEEELANTPYAFATERSLRLNSANKIDITINRLEDTSPSKDIEDDRFFNRRLSVEYNDLFGPQIDSKPEDAGPAFAVTQLIHAQNRYFDLSSRQSSIIESPKSAVLRDRSVCVPTSSARVDNNILSRKRDGAFEVLCAEELKASSVEPVAAANPAVPTSKRKKEKSFAILTETPSASRPSSPRSLPVDIRYGRVSPFKGRGFREETSRHTTPKTSAANSRSSSPPRRRTNSLSRIDTMAQTATFPPPIHTLIRPQSPRNFLKENKEEIRELSELNRERHEAEAERHRREEEEALLKEMGLLDKNGKSDAVRSVVGSRSNSRSNSPSKINLRSRSNSPAAILHFENIARDSKEFINPDDGLAKPVTHRSRLRSVSRSQPQSNDGSPQHSKIPKRQSSMSPARTAQRAISNSRSIENNLNKNQRFISNSTSSIHETIRIGSQVHDKRPMSQSTQHLNISPNHIKSKPPISPGRGGPPPSNKTINAKRLSPIVGTPNKSPIDDLKPSSAKALTKPSSIARKSVKTAGNTPAASKLNSRQPSRTVSRDPSPDKRKTTAKIPSKPLSNSINRPVSRTPSTKTTQMPLVSNKPEPKKPINRTDSTRSLNRTPSTKNLSEKPPLLKKRDSKRDLTEKTKSTSKLNEIGAKNTVRDSKNAPKSADKAKDAPEKNNDGKEKSKKNTHSPEVDGGVQITTQDNETQYDKTTNEKGELVIMTKKNIVSMTTAAITSQPLEVVTTVTNQLPAAFEKAREKGIFERLSSRDSLVGKDKEEDKGKEKTEEIKTEEKKEELETENIEMKEVVEKDTVEEKKPPKPTKNNQEKPMFTEDQVKLKPLQPPYNNPQVERVKQKIDDILKEPEVSRENILTASAKSREAKSTFKNIADSTKKDIEEGKTEVMDKLVEHKDQIVKQSEKITSEIRSEATKFVDSIITPVEEPKDVQEKAKEVKKDIIEPIVTVVHEKKNGPKLAAEKINDTVVKGEADVEVQSSNVSTPGLDKMAAGNKMVDENESDKSTHSNGGFPQSTSTTPKPPARTRKELKDKPQTNQNESDDPKETAQAAKQPNICQRLMGKCRKCCPCCVKGEQETEEGVTETENIEMVGKKGMMTKLNCCKKQNAEDIRDVEQAAGKAATIEFEDETKRKRKLRDLLCGCCGRARRVRPGAGVARGGSGAGVAASPGVGAGAGCCGNKRRAARRDSILSDRPPASCCNNRLCTWLRGMCRRHSEQSSSRRTSLFSKNKSMSPTLPPEDTRKKLDTTLVEHTSVMRGAIPVLPIVLAFFCLFCNIIVPGLGTIFSGMFCLCFGIPRFGVHDGAKHRMGSFLINLLVGCGQLFTVLFCLVGWGWSIWWGVIMVKVSRKYRKLRAEVAAEEAEAAPPVTANNHTRA